MLISTQDLVRAYTSIGYRHNRVTSRLHTFTRGDVAILHEEAQLGSFDVEILFEDARQRGVIDELVEALFSQDWELRDYV